jgi:hypothetical protein
MVFIGVGGELLLEVKKFPFNPTSFPPLGRSKRRIEIISLVVLLLGLFLEVVALPHSILESARLNKDAADMRLKAASLESRSPGSLPVASIYAVASLEIEATNSVRSLPLNAPYQVGGICSLVFVRNSAASLALDGESCNVLPLDGKHFLCVIMFRDSPINSWAIPTVKSDEPAEKVINEITGFQMTPLCLAEHTKIFSGKVKLVLNGSVIRELKIPVTEVSSFDNGNGWMIKSDMATNLTVESP